MSLRLLFVPTLLISFALQAQTVTWNKKDGPVGGQVTDIEVDPVSGNVFLLDGDQQAYKSVDGGNSWEKIPFANGDQYFYDIEITNNTIFLVGYWELHASVDSGQSFQSRMTGASDYQGAYLLKRMPSSGNLVVLCFNGNIYSSSNNGLTWTLKNSTLSGADTRYLQVNAVDQIFIVKPNASFVTRPFRSTDGGVSFTEASTGIPAGQHVLGLYGENVGGKVYCITNSDIYSSTNGTNWVSIKTAFITDTFIADYGDLQNSYVEFSADGLGIFFIDNLNHKLYSKALSATDWELQATDFPSGTVSAVCAAARDYPGATTATAYFGSPSGVFKTTTGGASVSENNNGIAGIKGEQMEMDDQGNLYLKTDGLGLLKSGDRGDTWAKVSTLVSDFSNFYVSSAGEALFARLTDYTLLRSFNAGSNWTEIAPPGRFFWIAPAPGEKIFALESSNNPLSLFYSPDNGNSWTSTAVSVSGLPTDFSIFEPSICFASAERMFLSLYDYNRGAYLYYRIDFTYDGFNDITSATATEVTTMPFYPSDFSRIKAANDKLFLFDTESASERVAISADGGVTWVTRSVPDSYNFFAAENGYLFFSDYSQDKLYLSRDDAQTFVETTFPARPDLYYLRDILLDESGYAFLAFHRDFVYQSTTTIVPPSPFTDFEEVGFSATTAALRWTDLNNGEREVIIERSLNGIDFDPIEAGNWNNCADRIHYVDHNLQPGTTYTYRVKAKNAAGESDPTSAISITTITDCAQTIPDMKSWSAINSGIEGYPLNAEPDTVGIKHLGGGKYEISDIALGLPGSQLRPSVFFESCGQTHIGVVGSLNPNGIGSWDGTTLTLRWRRCSFSDETETIYLTLNLEDPAPVKPSGLTAYVITNTATEVRWNSGYFETTYILERSLSPATGFAEIAQVNFPQTSFIDEGLADGTTYYYRLKSLNGNLPALESPYTDVVIVPFKKPNFIVADNAITSFNTAATLSSIWADFDNDGLEDYFTMQFDATNEKVKPMIFRNLGNGDFQMQLPDIGTENYFMPSVVDFDNDNFPDLALAGDETMVFDIFKGNGDFTFTKIPSGQLGDLAILDEAISASSWADINNDGLADLMLLSAEDASVTLYKQNANHTFTETYRGEPSVDEQGLLSIWADYDNDGFQDVLIGSLEDTGAGRLYHNNGDGTLTLTSGTGFSGANFFAAAWGDYNNDGNIDLFCGTLANNALYKNNGNGTFTQDVSTVISEANLAFSASWGDYNNDGFLDLMTVAFPPYQSRLFLRDPSVTASVAFKKIITEKINDVAIMHYSVANADPDQNGLLDLALSAFTFPQSESDEILPADNNFYQNNNLPGNWSEVKLETQGGGDALGARITLTAGGRSQTREISSGSSLVAKNSSIAHFGLGSATTITNVQVRWPNGEVQNYPSPPANQILIISEDVQPPVLTSHIPANNSIDVEINTPITLVFDDVPFAVNGKKLFITKTGEASPLTSVDVSTGVKTGNQYVLTLPVSLAPETEYNVTLDAGAFTDKYTNPSDGISLGVWKFQTPVLPVRTAFTPAHNANNVPATTNLTITFNEPVSTVAAKYVRLYKSTNLGSPVRTIEAANGTTNGNTTSFTISPKLERSVIYHVAVDAGAFTDGFGNALQGIASPDWVFTTDPGPSYSFTPLHNAINVPVKASLQITFVEGVTRVTGKFLRVTDGSTIISEADINSVGTLAGNVYTYPAPVAGWPYNKQLKVTLDVGGFIDAQGNDSAPVSSDSWNFSTDEAPDVTPPVIAYTPFATMVNKDFGTVNPSVTVTDDESVDDVKVSIRKISESDWVDLTATPGTGANTFSVTISSATHFDAIGAEYFITAKDLSGNTTRHPVGTDTYKVYINYNAEQSAIPTTSLGVGGTASSWKIFSVPFELTAPKNEVTAIFEEFTEKGLTNTVDYRLITLASDKQWSEYGNGFTTLSRGTGYFINFKTNPGAIDLFDNLATPPNSRSNLFSMNLKVGWNMIGNPYLTPISWDDAVELNDLSGTVTQLKKFQSGTYTNNQNLQKYEGGFVHSDVARTIDIPFLGQVSSGGRKGNLDLGTDISAESWALLIKVSQEYLSYELGGVGMAPEADLSIDNYDDLTPPRFLSYLELNFSHPEHMAKRFTRDIVPTQQAFTWDFTVDSNLEGMADLKWDNAPLITSGKDLFLLDVSAQKLVNMKEKDTYRFDPKESSRFRIYFGENLRIAPERVHLGKAYPNPTNGYTTIGYSLPETGGLNQSVTIDIIDAMGRTIGAVEQGRFNPGYHEAAFDAKEMKNGFYTYRLTVRNLRGQSTEVNKLIIK